MEVPTTDTGRIDGTERARRDFATTSAAGQRSGPSNDHESKELCAGPAGTRPAQGSHVMTPHSQFAQSGYLLLSVMLCALCPVTLLAQGAGGPSPELVDPLLTLEDAISLALDNNHGVKIQALEARKAEHQVNVARSDRLPKFHVDALAGSVLQPFDFTFPEGSFGTYPDTGPIPSTDAKIRNDARFTTFITGGVDQPLSQLYKINLGVHATELGRDMAREGVRAERQKVAARVRGAYFDLVATQAAVEAAREAVKTLTEVQRVTAEHEAQQTALRADVLEVDARLMKSRYELSAAENRLATQREVLNDLLGRDLEARFRVEPLPEADVSGLTLESARQHAAESRPELRQAQLRERQAEYERRLAKADYIPDVSLSVRYVGFYNYEVLPSNVWVAGLYLSWEPFDWKRRSNKVAQRALAVEQARNGAQQAGSQIAIEVGMTYRKWTDATLLVQATRGEYEAARERLRVMTNRYRDEAALLKDVLEAQARSSETQFQYQQALSSYWGAMAELRRAMGDE
jgi:outer membrane protein TolC